jgi:succinoglycan biosynthesis transport protein ExoP
MRSTDELDELSRLQGAVVQYPFEARSDPWPEEGRSTFLHRAIDLWRRRAVIITSMFVIIIGATLARLFLTPPSYEAMLKIFIKRARIETPAMDQTAGSGGGSESSESDVRSEMELFRSRDLLEKVVVKCGLASSREGAGVSDRRLVAVAVQKLEKDLLIAPVPKTNIIAIKYASPNPNQSADVLKVLSVLYIEKHTAMHRTHETSQFFAAQADRYHADLMAVQRTLSDFEQLYGASLLEQKKELGLKRIGDLEASIQQVSAQAEDASNRRKVLISQVESIPERIRIQSRTARNEALLEKSKSTLLDLENKRVQLLTKYEPSYPLVTEVDKQIRATKSAIEQAEVSEVVDQTTALNPLHQSAEAELSQAQSHIAGLLAQRASLMKDLQSARAREGTLERVTAEYNDLQRQKMISENDYLLYQKKMEEAHIADALDQHKFLNVSVLEDPVAPVLPVSRHSAFVLTLGFVLAILLSFGVALAVDSYNSLIRTPDELTVRTGQPILAAVSVSQFFSKAGGTERSKELGTNGSSSFGRNGA